MKEYLNKNMNEDMKEYINVNMNENMNENSHKKL